MLLEHYSESEIGKPFLGTFSKYLGRCDWMGNFDSSSVPFDDEIVNEVEQLILGKDVDAALNLLLSNTNTKDRETRKN